MSYEFLEHKGDVKFRAEGESLEEMFISSAEALFERMKGEVKVRERIKKTFFVEGKDVEEILYNFLEEFLFLLDSEGFLPARILDLDFGDKGVGVVVAGDDAKNYKFTNDVKAVTYHSMFVKKKGNKFVCEVVLDV